MSARPILGNIVTARINAGTRETGRWTITRGLARSASGLLGSTVQLDSDSAEWMPLTIESARKASK